MILRYEPTVESTPSGASARMVQRPDGEWCKYAQVLQLESAIELMVTARQEIEARAAELQRIIEGVMSELARAARA
jgi:hypothetical protein